MITKTCFVGPVKAKYFWVRACWLMLTVLFLGQVPFANAAKLSRGNRHPIFRMSFAERNEARIAAEAFAVQLDKARTAPTVLNSTYDNGGPALTQKYTKGAFVNGFFHVRGPLGAPLTRSFSRVSGGFRTLPNIDPGKYVIVIFKTDFVRTGNTYKELVTLQQDATSKTLWKFGGYQLMPLKKSL